MNQNQSGAGLTWLRFRRTFTARFSLHNDKASDQQIDEHLRCGVELVGATPWILIFAIFVACIGLNVNSTAVIIGAMLISPLMGPIMGLGYGIGIYDFHLVKRSFVNLGIATLIGLISSFLYFSVTPLSAAQSELLARTVPTLWDVMIALFGGLAGVVGATRKEKTNVIPGVAIATALMPPLCTAGYGLAQGNWQFFFGALYLFSINCVFIAVSTAIIITILHLPHQTYVDDKVKKRVKHALFVITMITAIPSLFLAYDLVRKEIFKNKAALFVKSEFHFPQTHVTDVNIEVSKKLIEVSLIGQSLDRSVLEQLNSKLPAAGLQGAHIVVHQGADNRIDIQSLKEDILGQMYRDTLVALEEKDKKIQLLQSQLAEISKQDLDANDILQELHAQYPSLERLVIGQGLVMALTNPSTNQKVRILKILSKTPASQDDKARIERWFRARSKDANAEISVEQLLLPKKPNTTKSKQVKL